MYVFRLLVAIALIATMPVCAGAQPLQSAHEGAPSNLRPSLLGGPASTGGLSVADRRGHESGLRFAYQPEVDSGQDAGQDDSSLDDQLQQEAKPGGGDVADLAKKLSNPIADLTSVPFQFNYDNGYGPDDAARVTLNIQPVIPITLDEDWLLISRTIVPVIYQEELFDGDDSDFGIGDTVQSLFFSPRDPLDGWIVGAGPVLLLPTGTDPQLRGEQLGLGPTGVALRQDGAWTYGALVNHIWGVTESDNADVNATFLQPFVSYTWPTATTLALNMEMTYDWDREETTLPLNIQLSQVASVGGQPVSFQGGFRYYADSPPGGPEWGLRFTITLLFPK